MSKDVYVPGDVIGTGEEFFGSQGTFEDPQGDICASVVGELLLDPKTHDASISPNLSRRETMKAGDVVVGTVASILAHAAMIDLDPVGADKKKVPSGLSSIVHVSKLSERYVKEVRDELRTGDIVRARIEEIDRHTVHLSTKGKHMGVILAFCENCRKPLSKRGVGLECSNCGLKTNRKTADDYGKNVLF